MTIDHDRSSRRAVLGAALGVGVAAVATALGRPSPVSAADGGNTILGAANEASDLTRITNTAGGAAAYSGADGFPYGALGLPDTGVWGQAEGSGIGVAGHSLGGPGVYGTSATGAAVFGNSPDGQAVRADSVSGYAIDATSSTGTAVRASVTTSGFALATTGRVKHGKVSGVKAIPAGRTSVTFSPGVDVTSGSFVLLTPKANIGSRDRKSTRLNSSHWITSRMPSSA